MNEVKAESHDIANIFFFATVDYPYPVVSISHVLFHQIHKPPCWPSLFPLSWQLQHIFNLL